MTKIKYSLFINTNTCKNVEIIILDDNAQQISKTQFTSDRQYQIKDNLLKAIDKILKQNRLDLKDLDRIIVVSKSKEMTSLRIGVSTANALAYSLDIPIIGIKDTDQLQSLGNKTTKTFEPVVPEYEINPMLKK